MAKVSTSISVDLDIKEKAQSLFSDLGLDLSTAVNMFLRQAVRENRIPFMVQREVPNADTIAAMKEAEAMAKDPGAYKSYRTFAELLDEVKADV